jgi:hypothetical protein
MIIVLLYGFDLLPEVESYEYSRNRSITMAAIILGMLPYLAAAIGSKIVFKLTNTPREICGQKTAERTSPMNSSNLAAQYKTASIYRGCLFLLTQSLTRLRHRLVE